MTSSSQRYEEPRWGRHRLPRRRLGAGLLAAVVLAIGGGVTVAAFGSEPAPAHADALCDQMRAQYGSNWPCISVPTNTFQPTTNTPAPTTGANGGGSGGPQVGSNIGPGPGEGNGTPIVTVPGQATPQPPPGGGNGGPGPTNPNAGDVRPSAPQPVPPGDTTGQVPVVPSTAVPAVTTVPGATTANPQPSDTPHALDSGSKQPDIPLAAWVVAGAAAFAAANPRVRRAAIGLRSAGGQRTLSLSPRSRPGPRMAGAAINSNVTSTTNLLNGRTDADRPTYVQYSTTEQDFNLALAYIYSQMLTNSQSQEVKNIRAKQEMGGFSTLVKSDGLADFGKLVQANGPWDHKPILRDLLHLDVNDPDGLYLPVPGTQYRVYYDIFSNIHYGYVGRAAGISRSMLIKAANINDSATGVNDRGDDMSMTLGMDLWDKYGDSMTFPQFRSAVVDLVNRMASENISQVRRK